MSVLGEVTKIYNMDPVKTSTPVASTSKQQHQIKNKDDGDQSVIEKGDFPCVEDMNASGISVPPNPPPTAVSSCGSLKATPNNRSMTSSLQRVKSQIVELFSRGNPSRSGSIRKMSKSKKKTELQTIFASGTSSSGEPRLLGATRKPSSTPMLREPAVSKRDPQHYGKAQSLENAALIANKGSRTQLNPSSQNGYRQLSKKHINSTNSSTAVNPPTSFRMCNMSSKCGANFSECADEEGVDSKILPAVAEDTVGEVNMKLRQENLQLWEDNRTLAAALEDAQVKLEYLQKRNKYVEVAMYQEGRILTDIIKECHEEIEKLKQTQCELLSEDINQALVNVRLEPTTSSGSQQQQQQDTNFDRKIREYYIEKYATAAANNGRVLEEEEDGE